MCANLSTTTQVTQLNILEYIMQIRLIITIYKGYYLHYLSIFTATVNVNDYTDKNYFS